LIEVHLVQLVLCSNFVYFIWPVNSDVVLNAAALLWDSLMACFCFVLVSVQSQQTSATVLPHY